MVRAQGMMKRASVEDFCPRIPRLLSEATSALDPTTIGEVLSVIRKLAAKGMTMVIVTHEMNFARDVSNRVFFLDDGIIYEEGTPEQVFGSPRQEKTRQFIRHLKILTIRIEGRSFDYAALRYSWIIIRKKPMPGSPLNTRRRPERCT